MDDTQNEGGEKREINEKIKYRADAYKPCMTNMFHTEKFEPFKFCCGNCYHLDMTQAIIATYNPCCACCSRMVYKY